MLAELGLVLQAGPHLSSDDVGSLVLSQNILQKRTGAGRRLSLRHLHELYGLGGIPPPISRAMTALWVRAGEGRPVLAVLAALACEVLLRDSAEIVLAAPPGVPMSASELFDAIEDGVRARMRRFISMIGKCSDEMTVLPAPPPSASK